MDEYCDEHTDHNTYTYEYMDHGPNNRTWDADFHQLTDTDPDTYTGTFRLLYL